MTHTSLRLVQCDQIGTRMLEILALVTFGGLLRLIENIDVVTVQREEDVYFISKLLSGGIIPGLNYLKSMTN